MSVDGEYELGRLAAQKELLEAITKGQSDDEQLLLSHADALVPSKLNAAYLSLSACLNSRRSVRTVW